jgi:hypothetical protein
MGKCYAVNPGNGVVFRLVVTPAYEWRSPTDWEELPFPSVRIGDASGSRSWGFLPIGRRLLNSKGEYEGERIAFAALHQGPKRIYLDTGGVDGQALALVAGFDFVTRTETYDVMCAEAYQPVSGAICPRCAGKLDNGRHVSPERQVYCELREVTRLDEVDEDDDAVVVGSGEDVNYRQESAIWFLRPCAIRLQSDQLEWALAWDGHFLRMQVVTELVEPIEDEEIEMGEPPISARDLRGHD